jgi:tyrosyl-tRNA synthetase
MTFGSLEFTPVKVWSPEDTKNFLIDGKLLILRKGKHNIRVVEMVSDEEWKQTGLSYPGEPGSGEVRRLRERLRAAKEAGERDAGPVFEAEELEDATEADDTEPTIVFPEKKGRQREAVEEELRRHLVGQGASRGRTAARTARLRRELGEAGKEGW